jgi:hypothetical protein
MEVLSRQRDGPCPPVVRARVNTDSATESLPPSRLLTVTAARLTRCPAARLAAGRGRGGVWRRAPSRWQTSSPISHGGGGPTHDHESVPRPQRRLPRSEPVPPAAAPQGPTAGPPCRPGVAGKARAAGSSGCQCQRWPVPQRRADAAEAAAATAAAGSRRCRADKPACPLFN